MSIRTSEDPNKQKKNKKNTTLKDNNEFTADNKLPIISINHNTNLQ